MKDHASHPLHKTGNGVRIMQHRGEFA